MSDSLDSNPFFFFDLDGPILDVKHKYHGFYAEYLSAYGIAAILDLDTFWSHKKTKTNQTEILAKSQCHHLSETYQPVFKARIEDTVYLKRDILQVGAAEFIRCLQSNYRTVLVTMRRNKTTLLQQLQDMGILGHFHKVLCAADHPNPEPPYWMVKRDLMLTLKDQGPAVAIIGDTETDMRAGQAVGIHTIAVENGIRTRELLEKENPTILVPGIHALSLDIINSLSCSALTLKL